MRCPWRDWPALVTGERTMFRAPVSQIGHSAFHGPTPGLCVAWTRAIRSRQRDSALMTLTSIRVEPLLAISPADLEREGFSTLKEFRRYWNARFRSGFDPMMKVAVIELRPLEPGDVERCAGDVLRHLYGRFMPAEEQSPFERHPVDVVMRP